MCCQGIQLRPVQASVGVTNVVSIDERILVTIPDEKFGENQSLLIHGKETRIFYGMKFRGSMFRIFPQDFDPDLMVKIGSQNQNVIPASEGDQVL